MKGRDVVTEIAIYILLTAIGLTPGRPDCVQNGEKVLGTEENPEDSFENCIFRKKIDVWRINAALFYFSVEPLLF